jgi:Rrf2 family protein
LRSRINRIVPNAISTATIPIVARFYFMPILSRKGLLAIAAVVDVALQTDGRFISAKTLAKRHGLPPRHLEAVLQSLVRSGILKGVRGPHGGYRLAAQPHGVTVNDILRAAGKDDAAVASPVAVSLVAGRLATMGARI